MISKRAPSKSAFVFSSDKNHYCRKLLYLLTDKFSIEDMEMTYIY
ncbi:hypothetical protein [Flavobacterium hydrophilum]|nr:hypothetical protein [Flavobacterium hydrophilum]